MLEISTNRVRPIEDFSDRSCVKAIINAVFLELEHTIDKCGYVPDYTSMSFSSYYDKDFEKVVFTGKMRGVVK